MEVITKQIIIKGLFIGLLLMMSACQSNRAKHINEQDALQDELLLQQIKAAAVQLEQKPINARIDSVWKAIPGYNGIVVNVEETLQYAKILKGSAIPFVYEEVPPDIKLDDLGAVPIYKGNPNKPIVAIMVNVAWGNEYIPEILKILEKEKITLTFFLDGSWLSRNIDLAKEIQDKGHELSNHAFSHKDMGNLSRQAAEQEIIKTEQLLKQHLHVNNQWFAPPSGHFSQQTVDIAYDLNLKTVLWTLDTIDWRNPDPDWIVRKVSAFVEPGTLILMHPTSAASQALPGMIEAIKQKGLHIGTVSDTLSESHIYAVESEFKL